MISIKFYNYQDSFEKIHINKETIFSKYLPDINKIKHAFKPYLNYKNYIIIGNGGSITSLEAYWQALGKGKSKKNLSIVSTMEPDYLELIERENSPKDTLVIGISKSGDTVGVLESLLALKNYPKLIITSLGKGTLFALAKKMLWPIIEHPEIGGRFSGRTPVAYGPAYLLGIDISAIEKGAHQAIKLFMKENSAAWKLAKFLYHMDQSEYHEIFMPVYSYFLEGFNHLVTQLIHESVAKNRKGQTILAVFAPESQHHTNQRFFGGPKNMVGVFVTVEKSHNKKIIQISPKCQNIPFRKNSLEILNNINLNNSLQNEAQGTINDAKNQGFPLAQVIIDKVDPNSVGEYLVFWQYVSYFLASRNCVNPFDQPQVEKSKEISFDLRCDK